MSICCRVSGLTGLLARSLAGSFACFPCLPRFALGDKHDKRRRDKDKERVDKERVRKEHARKVSQSVEMATN